MNKYYRYYPTKLGTIKAIKRNYQLIENNQFDELYKVLDKQNHYKINAPKKTGGGSYPIQCNIGELRSSVTQWLLAHNKSPLDYISQVYKYMFYNSDIKNIKLKDNIKALDFGAFYKCKKLKKVILPNSLTEIGTCAFAQNTSLERIVLPNSVTTIRNSVFDDCHNLQRVTLPQVLEYMGDYVFEDCHSLRDVVMPKSLKYIPCGTFENCYQLYDIDLPYNVETIYEYAFKGCTNLKSIFISSNIKKIEKGAFKNCSNLTIYYGGTKQEWGKVKKYSGHTKDIKEVYFLSL